MSQGHIIHRKINKMGLVLTNLKIIIHGNISIVDLATELTTLYLFVLDPGRKLCDVVSSAQRSLGFHT